MNALTEYVIALSELLEAEGRAFRQGIVLTGWALALVLVALFFVFAALGLWLWAIYLAAAAVMPSALAAALTGLVAFIVAGGLAWLSIRSVR